MLLQLPFDWTTFLICQLFCRYGPAPNKKRKPSLSMWIYAAGNRSLSFQHLQPPGIPLQIPESTVPKLRRTKMLSEIIKNGNGVRGKKKKTTDGHLDRQTWAASLLWTPVLAGCPACSSTSLLPRACCSSHTCSNQCRDVCLAVLGVQTLTHTTPWGQRGSPKQAGTLCNAGSRGPSQPQERKGLKGLAWC